jgi:hypothetical protein
LIAGQNFALANAINRSSSKIQARQQLLKINCRFEYMNFTREEIEALIKVLWFYREAVFKITDEPERGIFWKLTQKLREIKRELKQ